MLWCEGLRSLGFLDATRETLEWLLRSPAIMYGWARLWLDIVRDADAAVAMDCLAGSLSMLFFLLPGPELSSTFIRQVRTVPYLLRMPMCLPLPCLEDSPLTRCSGFNSMFLRYSSLHLSSITTSILLEWQYPMLHQNGTRMTCGVRLSKVLQT